MKVKEAIEKCLENKKKYLRPSSIQKYEGYQEKISDYFLDTDIENIKTTEIQKMVDYFSEKGVAKNSITTMVTLLKSSLYFFDENRHFNKLYFPAKKQTTKRCYTENEIKKILDYLLAKKQDGGWTRFLNIRKTSLPIVIAIFTGMRLGEIIALQWNDVNFKENYIDVNKACPTSLRGKQIITLPKTEKSIRKIPLHKDLKLVLLAHKKSNRDKFVLINTEKMMSSRTIQRKATSVCEKVGVEPKGFHAFRHYYATHLLSKNAPIKLVSEILGHSSIKITHDVYNNPDINDKQKVLKYF